MYLPNNIRDLYKRVVEMERTDTENDKPDGKEPRGPHPDLNPIFHSILAYPHRPPTSQYI